MDPHQLRGLQGRAAVLTVARAVVLLPYRDSEARLLIERSGVVKTVAGRRILVWGQLLDALDELDETATPKRRVQKRRRTKL